MFKTYSIKSSSPREIIPDVVDLLKSLSDTLYSMKNDTFPYDFVEMVATIFTTTSVPEFNKMFQSVLKQIQAVYLQDTIGTGFQVNILGGTNPQLIGSSNMLLSHFANLFKMGPGTNMLLQHPINQL